MECNTFWSAVEALATVVTGGVVLVYTRATLSLLKVTQGQLEVARAQRDADKAATEAAALQEDRDAEPSFAWGRSMTGTGVARLDIVNHGALVQNVVVGNVGALAVKLNGPHSLPTGGTLKVEFSGDAIESPLHFSISYRTRKGKVGIRQYTWNWRNNVTPKEDESRAQLIPENRFREIRAEQDRLQALPEVNVP